MDEQSALDFLGTNTYVVRKEAIEIYEELKKLPDKGRMLELGTGRGHSTGFFSHAKPNWTIYTIDAYGTAGGGPQIYDGKKMKISIQEVFNYIKSFCLPNVIQIVSSFANLPWELKINALFIDGSHWYKDVKADWDKFSPFVVKGGMVFFHDYAENYDVIKFFEKEVVPNSKWETWNIEGIGFAKKL